MSSLYQIIYSVLDENNEPLVKADGNILCHVVDNNGERDTLVVEPDLVNSLATLRRPTTPTESEVEEKTPTEFEVEEKKDEWTEDQTRFILDRYYEYLAEVGPMKRFRLKKHMWAQIASDINKKYKNNKTSIQVENRYKTIMKRKKKAVDNNQASGSKRLKVDFEEELKKIPSIDDGIEPEVCQDQSNVQMKETLKRNVEKTRKSETVVTLLRKMNEERKIQRERHHREKEENKEKFKEKDTTEKKRKIKKRDIEKN